MAPTPPPACVRYLRSVLGQQRPYDLPSVNEGGALGALLHADALWNNGKSCAEVTAAVAAGRARRDFNATRHGAFADGVEALARGELKEAYEAYVAACKVATSALTHGCASRPPTVTDSIPSPAAPPTSSSPDCITADPDSARLLSVFCSERAVNIAFWMACTGKMLAAGETVRDAVGRSAVPDTPYIAGVVAFAQHMNGMSVEAERLAGAAIERGLNDPWTLHAMAHCLYSLGRSEECAAFLNARRGEIVGASPSAFMKGHMEFHLALCLLDMRDGRALRELINGPLWRGMTDAERGDYWNATGLLAVLWKAELRGVPLGDAGADDDAARMLPEDVKACAREALSLVTTASPTKSAVFSLCMLRWRMAFGDHRESADALAAALRGSDNETLARVGEAVRFVYADGNWAAAAACVLPVAETLPRLGASPEQREVIEEFIGVVGANAPGAIDVAAWCERNARPNVDFYSTLMTM